MGSMSRSTRDVKTASFDLIEGIYCLNNFMQRQNFFVKNPKYQYRVIDFFNRWFSDKIFKDIFFYKDMDAESAYSFYFNEILSVSPQKNIPLSAYLLVSTNIYKLFIKHQAEEIDRLKNVIKDLSKGELQNGN